MIDLRKNKYEMPSNLVAFIDECEKQGWTVEVKKQFNSKTLLCIIADENISLTKFEFEHSITKPREYAKGLVKDSIEMTRKILTLQGAL